MGEIITRQQACKRLMRAAIVSFVRNEEPLAIHLCIQAAFRVCRDIVKKKNQSKDWFQHVIRPERFKEFIGEHARLASFLKHANKDPDAKIDLFNIYNRNMHDLVLLGSYYEAAFGIHNDPFIRAYMIWYFAKHPECMDQDNVRKNAIMAYGEVDAWNDLTAFCRADKDTLAELARLQPDHAW